MGTLVASSTIDKPGRLKKVALDEIRADGGTQMRERLDDGVLDEYQLKLAAGVEFPQLIVYFDGSEYWLADGFHRYFAACQGGHREFLCEVRQGTKRDAVLYACGANSEHGKQRTSADKQKAVKTLLNDAEWSKWSNREIARRAGVSSTTVDRLRPEPSLQQSGSEPRTYTTKHGTTATMNTANIGKAKRAASTPPAPEPTSAAPATPPTPSSDSSASPAAVGGGGGAEPDAIDRLVQSVGGTKAADPTGPVHHPDDFKPLSTTPSLKAMPAVRPSVPLPASTQISLPHDADRAAAFLIEQFGPEYAAALTASLAARLSATTEEA